MPVIPWKMAEAPVAGNRYLALISYLPLKHFRAIPNFFLFTSEIRRQLRTAPGLIGYSLDARPFARTFWTLSVWRDQQSLRDFANQAPHNRRWKRGKFRWTGASRKRASRNLNLSGAAACGIL